MSPRSSLCLFPLSALRDLHSRHEGSSDDTPGDSPEKRPSLEICMRYLSFPHQRWGPAGFPLQNSNASIRAQTGSAINVTRPGTAAAKLAEQRWATGRGGGREGIKNLYHFLSSRQRLKSRHLYFVLFFCSGPLLGLQWFVSLEGIHWLT